MVFTNWMDGRMSLPREIDDLENQKFIEATTNEVAILAVIVE